MLSGVAAQQQHRGGSYILGNQWCPNKLLIYEQKVASASFSSFWTTVGWCRVVGTLFFMQHFACVNLQYKHLWTCISRVQVTGK